ncbi:substrate-binding domain-containing protein [Paenibacillus sp. CF384]|uniref:substrate-binding domain-containing protein n=1 Tax=Paenibacillus sp. CF384 TaxID=1884382 RepID=UPI00089C0310|nr:substrate-binding domain-containing protein [Paenibacillus sp. CF384]SDX75897.1 monosaccharide ABC transporter substrate-binding protein, CUT2 family [Paenibacillus sp. CF384]
MFRQRFTIGLALVLFIAAVYSIFYFKLFSVPGHHEKSITVVLKSLNVRSDFWQAVRAGSEAAAKETGLSLSVQGPLQEGDADEQIHALEEAIREKPQAIVVAPYADDRMPALFEQIRDEGIKLVVIDTPLEMKSAPVVVSNNHVEAGRLAGETAVNETKRKPVIAIISDDADATISKERLQGLKHALERYKNSIIGVYYAEQSEDKAYEIAKKLQTGDGQSFNTFITMNESATIGVAKLLKEQNKAGAIKLIGFDSSFYEIQLLEEGVLNAVIVQKPFNMGYLGVKKALSLIEGTNTAPVTYIESNVINRKNMYLPENQKLLFPFIENK